MIKMTRILDEDIPGVETHYTGKDIITYRELFPSECSLINTEHLDYTCKSCSKSRNDHFVLAQRRLQVNGCNAFFIYACDKKGVQYFEPSSGK